MTEIAALQNQNSPPTMPFATEFLVVFRHTLYSHLWKKKKNIFKVKILSNKKSLSFPAAVPKDTQLIFLFCLHHAILSVQQTLELFAACKTYFVAMVTSSSKYHYQIKKKPNENKTKNPNTSKVRWFCYDFAQFHKKIVLQLGPWEITGSSRQEQNAEKMFLLCPAALNCYINHSNRRIRTQLPEKHRNFRNMWCSKFIIVADLFSISTWM